MTKTAGSGSGSISQKHGSADPDPYQNVMDPQHWYLGDILQTRSDAGYNMSIVADESLSKAYWQRVLNDL